MNDDFDFDFTDEIDDNLDIIKSKESEIEDGNAEIDDHLLKIYKEKNCETIEKIKGIGLPKKNEQLRLITMRSFNSISFIEYVAKQERIKNMTLVIFAINMQAARLILELYDKNYIENIELIISSVRNAGFKIKSKAVDMLSKRRNIKMLFVSSHAKISALETKKGNYYIIEGSGNMSFNARIEQYMIDNDKKVYDFTLSWIKDMKKSLWAKDRLIINK